MTARTPTCTILIDLNAEFHNVPRIEHTFFRNKLIKIKNINLLI